MWQRSDDPVAGAGPDLDELCRLAARQMIATALEAERRAYLDAHADQTDAAGKRLVVGNGYANERTITTAAGRVEVRAPRVDDRREGERFVSSILPPYMRKSPKVTEVLPILYLRGLSTGDFAPALSGFFGSEAGLSASTVNRLTTAWQAEHADWSARDLSGVDYVYVWADGVHVNVRLPDADGAQDRLCLLVIVGVRPDGRKELVAVADGHREDTESWLDLLRDLRDRGMAAPELAVGDGALGFWAALAQVFGSTRTQRCWVHKVANVLAALPKRLHPQARVLLQAIYTAETRTAALEAARVFADQLSAWPKATRKVTDELDTLLAFFDFPAEHWKHLRTTNAIEFDVRDRAAAAAHHQGPGQPRRRGGDGLQAHGRRPGPVAADQRPRAGRPGPRRRHVHRRPATRTERHHRRDDHRRVRRLNVPEKPVHNS